MKVNHIKRYCLLMFLFAIPHILVASDQRDPYTSLTSTALDYLYNNRQLTQDLWLDSQEYTIELNNSKKISDIIYAYFKNEGTIEAIKEAQSDDKLVETIASVLDQKPFTEEFEIKGRSDFVILMEVKRVVDQYGNILDNGVFNAPTFQESFEEKEENLSNCHVDTKPSISNS